MWVRARLFASAAEAAGVREWSGEVPAGTTAAGLLAILARERPALAALLPRCAVAVDRAYADRGTVLHDGAEVAVIPPVSGGAGDLPARRRLPRPAVSRG